MSRSTLLMCFMVLGCVLPSLTWGIGFPEGEQPDFGAQYEDPPDTRTPEQKRQDLLLSFKSELTGSRGEWLNVPVPGAVSEDMATVEKTLSAVIQNYIKKQPGLANIPIHIFIFKNEVENAWVARYFPGQTTKNGLGVDAVSAALGHDAKKGFIEFAFTTGILGSFKNEGAQGIVTGHESGHILEGHLKNARDLTWEELKDNWWNGQLKELAADARAVELAAGLYDLDDGVRFMTELMAQSKSESDSSGSLVQRAMRAIESATSTHPHEGVRLAAMEAHVHQVNGRLLNRPQSKPLPDAFARVAALGRSQRNHPEDVRNLIHDAIHGTRKLRRSTVAVEKTTTALMAEALDQESQDPALKLRVFLDLLQRSLGGGSSSYSQSPMTLQDSLNLSTGAHLPRVNQWISALSPQTRTEILDSILTPPQESGSYSFGAKEQHQMHRILLALSTPAAGSPSMRSEFDGFSAEYYKRTIDSFLFLDRTGDSPDDIEKEIKNVGSSMLKSTILRMALERLKALRIDNAVSIAKQAFLARPLERSAYKQLESPYHIYTAAFQRLSAWSQLPEAAPLRLGFRQVRDSMENEIFERFFRGYRFPEGRQIQERQKPNPNYNERAASYYDIPYNVPDFAQEPFERFQWLTRLSKRHLDLIKPELASFFESVMAPAIPFSSQRYILDGLNPSYRPEYDQLIAEVYLRRNKSLTSERCAAFFVNWHLLRQFAVREQPFLKLETQSAIAAALREIPDQKLLKAFNMRWAFNILQSFGHTRVLFDHMTIGALGEFFDESLHKSESDSNFSMEVFDDALTSLTKRPVKTVDEARAWFKTLKNITSAQREAYSPTNATQAMAREASRTILKTLPTVEALELMKAPRVRNLLHPEDVASYLTNEAKKRIMATPSLKAFAKPDRLNPATEANRSELQSVLTKMEEEFKLQESATTRYDFRDLLARELQIQPQDRAAINPAEGQTITSLTEGAGVLVRSFSGLLAAVRTLPIADQLSFIYFVTGRTNEIPKSITEIDKKYSLIKTVGKRSLAEWVLEARDRMKQLDDNSRTVLVHSLMTGPTGLVSNPEGMKLVENAILAMAPREALEETQIILQALKESQGGDYKLLLSFALAQKAEGSTAGGQAGLLKAFIMSFGVPGGKFGQLIAFASAFKAYRKPFESIQDNAFPVSYLGLLELLATKLGADWDPMRYRVVGIKGSGTVNLAVEVIVYDRRTKEHRILNVLREEIEPIAKNDFLRFQKFIASAVKIDTKKRLGYIPGVAKLIEDSVMSEFDKARSKEMHDASEVQYSHRVGEWTVRSIHVHSVIGRALEMELAQGKSAVAVKAENPEIYREGLSAYLTVAEQRMRGIGPDGKPSKGRLITDGDIHNGQFTIDVKRKIWTLLDKGQAHNAAYEERELGRTLLRFAAKETDARGFAEELRSFETLLGVKITNEHVRRFAESESKTDVMDRYLNILATLREIGRVPQASMTWGFEFYRSREFAEELGPVRVKRIEAVLATGAKGLVAQGAFGLMDFAKSAPRPELLPVQNRAGMNRCESLFAR
jgi:hypothetical protein